MLTHVRAWNPTSVNQPLEQTCRQLLTASPHTLSEPLWPLSLYSESFSFATSPQQKGCTSFLWWLLMHILIPTPVWTPPSPNKNKNKSHFVVNPAMNTPLHTSPLRPWFKPALTLSPTWSSSWVLPGYWPTSAGCWSDGKLGVAPGL